MKTRVKQILAIAFLALIILTGNVNAKGIEKSALSHENTEEALQLENWMIADDFWVTSDVPALEIVNDESLDLESWMINDNIWNLENTIEVKTESEQELTLETWMTNESIWNR